MTKQIDEPKPKRRRFLQFSLLSMLVLMFVSALGVKIYRDYYLNRTDLDERKLADGSVLQFQQRKIDENAENRAAGTRQGFGRGIDGLEKHGIYIATDKHGRILCQGRYESGEPSGRWSISHLNGRLALTGVEVGAVRHGNWKGWHASGSKAVEVPHAAPLEVFTGERKYNDEGKIEHLLGEKANVTNRHGRARAWWPNGKLRREGRFESDRRAGTWTFWNQAGQVVAMGEYQNGQRQGVWQLAGATGQLRETFYVHDHPVDDVQQLFARLANEIDSTDLAIVERAYTTLGALDERGVSLLVRIIAGDKFRDLNLALEQLALIGPAARDALPAILALATHENQLVRASAVVAVFAIEPGQRDDAFSQLVAMVSQASGRQQQQIFSRVGSLGSSALPHLDLLLRSDQLSDRLVALNVLYAMILDGRLTSLADRQPEFQEQFYDLVRRTANNHPDPHTARLAKFVLDYLESCFPRNIPQPFVGSILPVVG